MLSVLDHVANHHHQHHQKKKMFGTVSHELEANVPASVAWELYGTLRLAKLAEEEAPEVINKVDLLEGDGGVGTVLRVNFPPDTPGFTSHKEKFVKVDNEKRVKDAEVIEGGFLDLGFSLYRVRFEIIEKGEESCILKSTIEYDVKEEAAANASIVTIQPLAHIAELAKNYLIKTKTN
ncbi:hypothetical protein L1049_002944 [Liquidambar formosana]|uniref:Bet v I/Major latex protein domain-containing protein n=1 Tax=Liquidambar formosana TaxID=63359 RepID=A0AAP0NJ37_LIQFO